MSLSPTGEKLIQKLKAEASRSQVSDTGSKVIEQMNKKSQSDYFNSVLPPEAAMGATANSSQQVKKERSSLGKIFAGGVLFGGADAGDYAEVGKMFAQGVARGYQATGSFLARTAADPKNASLKNSPVVDPKTIFGNSERAASIGTAIFGTEEPFSLKSEGDDIFNFIGLDNATPWQSASFAVLMTTADLFTGGASSGLRGSMLALKNADNVADTAKVMRTMGFDGDIISDYAPLFSKADNAEDIGDIFMGASKLQQSTKLINNAPINILDGSKPITPAGKVFSTSASDMRKSLLKTLSENRGVVDKGVESRVLRNASPTVDDYQVVIDTLQDAGIKMDDAVETLADLKETMRTDPKRFVPKYAEKTDLDLPPSKKGTLLVTEGAFRVREGDVPVRGTDDLQDLPVTDARFKQEGRIPVAQEAAVKNIPIEDARYAKEGTVPVSGVRNAEPQAVLVTGTQPLREGTIPVTGPKNAQTVPIKQGSKVTGQTDIEVKKLDEIAQPDKHPMSIPASKIQERYGDNGLKVKQLDNITEVEESLISQLNAVFTGDAFPAWVPRELQNAGLFERVIDMLKNGEVPTVHGSGEMELYTTFLDESARRAGITAKPERSVSPGQAMVQAMREKMGAPVVPRAERQYEKSSVVNKDTPDFGTKIDNAEQAVEDYKKYNRHMQTASGHKGFNEGEVKSFGFLYAEDISGFKGWVKDMYRNSEKVFGDAWPAVKKRVFDKFDDAKGAMVRTEAEQIGKVKAQVVDALGIKRKSKLSALVQKYGEKTDGFSYDEVVALVGKADADKIHTAHTFFRAEYDRMIIEINDINKKLFPGRKDKQITPRQNYYRHFNELTELDGAYKAFEDPGLGNLSNKGTPTNRWLSIAQKRLGLKTDFDAVGGFLDYVPQYAFAKHVEPATQEIMAFKKSIRENTSAGQLDNYLAMLDRMTDDLLGLANPLDGGFESLFGRRALNVLDYTNKRVKRNAILGNAGTAISQIFNVPNAVMQAGPIHSAVGIKRALAEVMNPDAASWSRGTFINERYKQGVYDQFNVGMMENSMQFAGWMISALDEVGTKFAWYAHYDKALKTMIDVDAIRYADDMTRKSVAGRGIGEVPIMQKGKVFQTIAPFQLEVANTLFNLGDVALAAGKAEGSVAKSKELSRYITFIAATYLMNETAEKITGREVTMNPGQVLFDSYEIALSEKTAWEKTKAITGRTVGEAVTGVPLAPYLASSILKEEEREVLGMTLPASGEFFGEDADPVKYGAPQPLLWRALNATEWDSALDPFTSFVTPWGGAQIKKTVKGLDALAAGGVYDKDGNKMMDVKPGAVGALQNILFGHWNPNVAYKDQIESEITSLVEENNALVATGQEHNYDLARQNYEDLSPEMRVVYGEMKGAVNMKEKERQQNAMRPTLKIIDTLIEQERYDDARAITAAMTESEQQSIVSLKKRLEEENKVEFVPEDWEEDTVIQTVLDYSYAFMVSPQQTFKIMFENNEIIEDSIGGFGGVVRTRRMPQYDYDRFEGSTAVKQELMKEAGITDSSTVSLEHKLPLGMGGSNLRTNLELVSREQHDAWTQVEVDLINAIKDKKLTWKEAQIYILRHKGYEGNPISHDEILKIINSK